MSEQEGFLRRWSRRKRESDEETQPAPSTPPASSPRGEADVVSPQKGPEPAVDLSALPPIDSITAATDIRAFLAPGIPAQLTRAALRRAWAADPAIRDFVGLAENAWDFNAPEGIPGFGSLGPTDQAQRLIAELAQEARRYQQPAEVEEDHGEPPVDPAADAPSAAL